MRSRADDRDVGAWLLRAAPLAALLLAGAVSCKGIDERSHNDAELLLRSVPVPRPAEGLKPVGPADDGQAAGAQEVVRQTYSIDLNGELTLNEVTETTVGYFGADVTALDGRAAERLGVEPYGGVLVRAVHGRGPAGRAGVRVDDIVTRFGGAEVAGTDRLAYLVQQADPGAQVEIEVVRKGERIALGLELGAEKLVVSSRVLGRSLPLLDDRDRTGLRLAEVTEDVRGYILGTDETDRGLLVLENLPGGPAFFADLRIRDCILEVDGRPVRTLQEYSDSLRGKSAGDGIGLTVLREGLRIEKDMVLSENETETGGYNVLGLVKYRRGAGSRSFGLLWDILFNCEAYHCVRQSDEDPQNTTQSRWGCILNLIAYRSTPKLTELRLLWLFPISARSD